MVVSMKNIYEINTAVWLSRLSQQQNQPVSLATVPEEEIERIASFGMDTVWLMGIWQRSPLAAAINAADASLVTELTTLLPDFTPADIIGSAYAVKNYTVDERFGGEAGLQTLRSRLAARGIKLLLDFVPNHTAFDHPWLSDTPERYISATAAQHATYPTHQFRRQGGLLVAHGQDPTLSPWNDVAQLNAFSDSYRQVSIETLRHIASLADGVRCDMAMLLINDIFAKSWGELAGPVPADEYWQTVIDAVRQTSPDFVFVAECYWETETKLVELGFDYVYDKTTYDYLVQHNPTAVEYHVETLKPIESHLLHFLENHDEPRAADVFSADEGLGYAALIVDLPGACLWHDGQFEGYQKRIPVHVRRGPPEPINHELLNQYTALLSPRHNKHEKI